MPGRAKLPPGKGKRVPLNMRTTKEVRALLEHAAADSGRSLVQEVEFRLERSFLNVNIPPSIFGGVDSLPLAIMIGSIMRTVKDKRDDQTLADPYILSGIEIGIYQFFRTLREALPETMQVDDPRASAGIDVGREAADAFVMFARRHYDSLRDPGAKSTKPVSPDDVEELSLLAALRFAKLAETGNIEED